MYKKQNSNSKIFKSGKSKSSLLTELKEDFRNLRNRYSLIQNVSLLAMLFLIIFMWQCKKDDFKGETKGVCPEVTVTDPVNGALSVVTSKKITTTFNEKMDSSTINSATFIVKQGTALVGGTVTYSGTTATFIPANLLVANTVYICTITTGALDLDGNALPANHIWSFNTGVTPTVIATDPANGSVNVALNKIITATFSTPMDPLSITSGTMIIKQGTTVIPGAITYLGATATFIPSANLTPNTVYTGIITTGAKDVGGNALASNFIWSFATSIAQYTITLSSNPLLGGTTSGGGAFNTGSSVTAMASPATGYTFTNWTEGVVIASTNMNYTFLVAGNRTLVANFAAQPTGPAMVDLGCASDFIILAGSTVSNTGNTIITGDIGLSPGSSMTGFPPGIIIGSLSVSNPTSANGKICLTSAFNDAAGRSLDVIVVADGELGGKTLAPGLYKSAPGSFGITNSDLTLNAQGNANAVWIFQMPSSTLTVGNGRKVILSGGAQAKNIFWQVGSSATIGTTAAMKGNILADQSITMQTGATLEGRVLARIGAVTLDFNMITKP